ncbi:MAG: hypothetical protein WBG86_18885 [Polyangiales bacterium]
MSYTDQITRSSTRLQSQGVLFFQQTQKAGEAFLADSRVASVTFADAMGEAGATLVETVAKSVTTLGQAFRTEAVDWRDLSIKTREAYVAALSARFQGFEKRAEQAQAALQPTALQSKVLQATHEVLGDAQKLVEAKLDEATEAPAKPTAKAATKARAATKKGGRIPIRNYDQLTAKDVVGRLQRLSGPQATAVLDYERSRKNRTTVVKAAKLRLAAS